MSKLLSPTFAIHQNWTAKMNTAVLFAMAVFIFVVAPSIAKADVYTGATGSTFTAHCNTGMGGIPNDICYSDATYTGTIVGYRTDDMGVQWALSIATIAGNPYGIADSSNFPTSGGYLESASYVFYKPNGCNTGTAPNFDFSSCTLIGAFSYNNVTGEITDNATTLYTLTPAGGSVLATSTTNTLGYTGYLLESDLNEASSVYFHIENSACRLNGDCRGRSDPDEGALKAGSGSGIYFTRLVYLDNSGHFSWSTTTQGLPIGTYYVTANIMKGGVCIIGFCFNTRDVLYSTTTSFIISTTTKADKLITENDALRAALTREGTAFEHCGISDFDLLQCGKDFLLLALIPSDEAMKHNFDLLKDGAFSYFPLGYIRRFVTVFTATTTADLPVLSYTFPSVPAIPVSLQGETLSFDPWDSMSSTSPILSIESYGDNPQTFWGITMPYIDKLIYLILVLKIVSELVGIAFLPTTGSRGALSDTNSADDSYRLKETLYRMQKK